MQEHFWKKEQTHKLRFAYGHLNLPLNSQKHNPKAKCPEMIYKEKNKAAFVQHLNSLAVALVTRQNTLKQ